MGRCNCLPLQPFRGVRPGKYEQVTKTLYSWWNTIRWRVTIESTTSWTASYTRICSKYYCRQETAVRTVAQTLGGIAVFRFGIFKTKHLHSKSLFIQWPTKDFTNHCFSRVIQVLWSLEIAETHVGRSHSAVYNVISQIKLWRRQSLRQDAIQVCSADLTVPVLHGAIIEGVATLICRLGSRLVALKEPQYDLD